LQGGFKDVEGAYMTSDLHRGVWVTFERPWDLVIAGPPPGEDPALLVIDLPEPVFAEYEWIEEGKGYREALVPAAILNRYRVYRAWECDECGVIAAEGEPGWHSEIVTTAFGERVRVTTCPECMAEVASE
jgi:hypothetical protein